MASQEQIGFQSGYAEVNGTRLYFETAGSGMAVALVQGFGLDTRMWDDQFTAFARHHRVVRYDGRGFGRSAVPDGSPYRPADDLKALLEHLGIARAAVLGLSLGGGIAVEFALLYPASTVALVVASGVLPGYTWGDEFGASIGAVWSASRGADTADAARELWLRHAMFAPILRLPAAGQRFERMVRDYSGWDWLHADSRVDLEPRVAERLGELRLPLLAIVGEDDVSDFHHIAALFERVVTGAWVVTLAGAGHMVNMEQPDRFNEITLAFLAGTRGSRAD